VLKIDNETGKEVEGADPSIFHFVQGWLREHGVEQIRSDPSWGIFFSMVILNPAVFCNANEIR